MGLGARHRNLRNFINQEDIKVYNEKDELVTLKTYCKKVKG
jgi:hypothetical protein